MPSRSPSPRTERAMTARCDHGQASAAYRWWRSGPPSGRPRKRLFWRTNSPLRGVVAGTPPRLGVAADEDDDAAERGLGALDGSGGILGHAILLAWFDDHRTKRFDGRRIYARCGLDLKTGLAFGRRRRIGFSQTRRSETQRARP